MLLPVRTSATTRILRATLLAAALLCCRAPAFAADQAALLAQGCLGCHGRGGAGARDIPGIADRPAARLRDLMLAFRAGDRSGTIMTRIARGYTDAEIAAIAAHFARRD